jgi:ribokinase
VLVVLQMEVPAAEVEVAIARAKAAGATVLLNVAPALPLPIAALRKVDILVLNELEAAALCTHFLPDRERASASAEAQLRALTGLIGASVILTLGSEGAVAGHNGRLWRIGALPVAAVDTTGAGDCFVGVLAAGLERGAALPDAMRRATLAASLACTTFGAQPSFPTGPQIDDALARPTAPSLQERAL